jgi:hypothetical protein
LLLLFVHLYLKLFCRVMLFDAPPDDPNYGPLPEEERPGGFAWGGGEINQER